MVNVRKIGSSLPDRANSASIIDRVEEENGIVVLRGIEVDSSLDITTPDADDDQFDTIEKKILLGFSGSFAGDVTIGGDLTVLGTTTTVESSVVTVSDNIFTLNDGETGAGVTLGTSGIEIDRGTLSNSTWLWDEANDYWTGSGAPIGDVADPTNNQDAATKKYVDDHANRTDNPHTVTATQVGALVSVDGVSNAGGNIDLIAANAISITPNDGANTITISETHSTLTSNPHSVSATQVGALVSVDGVSNAGGDIDLISGGAISITPNDGANTITITETHSTLTNNPHSVTATQTGALVSVGGVSNPGGDIALLTGGAISITPNDGADTITISETHSALTNNPHSVTAAQAGAAPVSHVGSGGASEHAVATTSVAGFLSASDKTKLDGIATGADVSPVADVFGRTGNVVAVSGDYTASEVTNVPAGNIAATDVQAAINELDTEKADASKILTGSAALDFGSIATQTSADLTISVTGAAVGDTVALGLPAAPTAGIAFNAFVDSANSVTVRAHNYTGGAVDPASATYKVTVFQY